VGFKVWLLSPDSNQKSEMYDKTAQHRKGYKTVSGMTPTL
jgi:hypothetical protein